MKNIFVTAEIPQKSLKILQDKYQVDIFSEQRQMSQEELYSALSKKRYDALICTYLDRITKPLLETVGQHLSTIGTLSKGTNHIDRVTSQQKGIEVLNVDGVTTDAVADYVVCLVLLGIRRLDKYLNPAKNHQQQWYFMGNLEGTTLSESTIGIFGMGKIGTEVCRRISAFKAKVCYCSRTQKLDIERETSAVFCHFNELLSRSDVLIVCCDLNPSTINLFNKDSFQKMKAGSIFINISRGEVCNHEDLNFALQTNKLRFSLLDVTHPEPLPENHPLRDRQNCLIFPHIGTNTLVSREKLCDNLIWQIDRDLLHKRELPVQIEMLQNIKSQLD
ncbi:MAG: NAD(P)-dependent oxidoreductase [Microcoleaceae cyanobacterium]